jgi:hypothetical protein
MVSPAGPSSLDHQGTSLSSEPGELIRLYIRGSSIFCTQRKVARYPHDLRVRPTTRWPTSTHDSSAVRRGSCSRVSCS